MLKEDEETKSGGTEPKSAIRSFLIRRSGGKDGRNKQGAVVDGSGHAPLADPTEAS